MNKRRPSWPAWPGRPCYKRRENIGSKTRINKKALFLALSVPLFVIPWIAWASDEKPDTNGSCEYLFEDVVGAATRSEIPEQDIAANITVITAEEIDKIPASTAADAIRRLPGVFVVFKGRPGSVAAARIQGSDSRHVAVYRDRVSLGQLANPRAVLSSIPIDAIEKIEV